MIRIDEHTDPLLQHYRQLHDKQLSRREGRFIAEGKRVTQRLLESGLRVESVTTDLRRAAEMAPIIAGRAPHYVVSEQTMTRTTGFRVHTGVLSIGFRPPRLTIDDVMRDAPTPCLLLVVPFVKEPSNLGALIRTAAAFGVTAIILGDKCADPYYRRTIRVSMATVFRTPIIESDHLAHDLKRLEQDFNIELAGTVLDDDAQPLHQAKFSDHHRGMALLIGHEVFGLDAHWAKLCTRKLIIPMQIGTDSLNVSVATAVCCYHLLAPDTTITLPEALEHDTADDPDTEFHE